MSSRKQLLRDVVAWGAGLAGFSVDHAMDGVILAEGYLSGFHDADGRRVPGIGPASYEVSLVLAMDIAWLLWLDDRFDLSPGGEASSFSRSYRASEDRGFVDLRSRVARAAKDERALRAWVDASEVVVEAYREDHLFSRGERSFTYVEYIENGEKSIGVRQCVATIAALLGYDMPSRLGDQRFQGMLRNLSLAMRLQNDLMSAEAERALGDKANAVFILEASLLGEDAKAFIDVEQAGYTILLHRDLSALGEGDPFSRIARVMMGMTERFYRIETTRYAQKQAEHARAA